MQSSPTLWEWLKAHKFMVGMLLGILPAAYGFVARDVDDHWWQYMLVGAACLLNFGLLMMMYERPSRTNRVVGLIGLTAGSLVVVGLICLALFFVLTFALILYLLMQIH